MDYSAALKQDAEDQKTIQVLRDPAKQDPDSPDYRSASYRMQLPDVELMRQVYGGTKTMREQKEKFLPQHPMEVTKKYEARVRTAVAYNAVRKTVEGLTGMIFRRDPKISDDMAEEIQQHLENIDLRGNKFALFMRKVADQALLDGHTWVHVEAPSTTGIPNRLEGEKAGVRPYWINVKKAQAINWRYEIRGGRPVLTLFVYLESATVADGAFGEKTVQRIRVLKEGPANVQGELWELREVSDVGGNRSSKWVRIEQYEVGVQAIPVWIFYAEQCGDFESQPPLLDLAYEQVDFYRVRSDYQKSLTFSSVAVPWLFGRNVVDEEGNSKVKWGPDGMLVLNDPEASAGMLESQGFGLEANAAYLASVKENMASLGLRMLVRQPNTQPQTATSDVLNKSESNANLASFATTLEDGANGLLMIHASYLVGAPTPGTVEINRDFHEQMIEPQFIQVIGDQVAAGRLSLDTMWQLLVDGEVLPEEFDPEEERKRIEDDGALGMGDVIAELQAAARARPPAKPPTDGAQA